MAFEEKSIIGHAHVILPHHFYIHELQSLLLRNSRRMHTQAIVAPFSRRFLNLEDNEGSKRLS